MLPLFLLACSPLLTLCQPFPSSFGSLSVLPFFTCSLLVLALYCSQCGIMLSFSGDAIPVVTFPPVYFGLTMFSVLYMLECDALATSIYVSV